MHRSQPRRKKMTPTAFGETTPRLPPFLASSPHVPHYPNRCCVFVLQQRRKSNAKQSQRAHRAVQPQELGTRGLRRAAAARPAQWREDGGAVRARRGRRIAGRGRVRRAVGAVAGRRGVEGAARVVLQTGRGARAVAAAGGDTLLAPLGAHEVGQGEGILGDVGGAVVGAEAAIGEGVLEEKKVTSAWVHFGRRAE